MPEHLKRRILLGTFTTVDNDEQLEYSVELSKDITDTQWKNRSPFFFYYFFFFGLY